MLFLLFILHCLSWWSSAARVPLLQFDVLWLLWNFWSYGISQLLFGSVFALGTALWILTVMQKVHCRTVGWLDGAVASPFFGGQLDDLKFRGDPRHPIVLALRRFHGTILCKLPLHRVPIRWRRDFQQGLYECQHAVGDLTPGSLIAFAYRACMLLMAIVSDPSVFKSTVDRNLSGLFAAPECTRPMSSCLRQRSNSILPESGAQDSSTLST